MHISSFIALPFALGGWANAAPALSELAASSSASAAIPSCTPFNYPTPVNTTNPAAFFLQVRSNNPLTNGRNVQLRPAAGAGNPQIAVVDPSSPVLLSMLRSGTIYSENRTTENGLYDLGPSAQLKNVNATATSSLQEFFFINSTATEPSTANFQLVGIAPDAQYNLYHKINEDGVVNGFTACQKAGYFQIFYYTYQGEIPNFGSDCEYIGLQTTVAPLIVQTQ